MAQRQIVLRFSASARPELEQITLRHPLVSGTTVSYRGKSASMAPGAGSFQWTSAVRGFALLLNRVAISALDEPEQTSERALVSGESGSLAASLDDALYKLPLWMREVFSDPTTGTCHAARFFMRSNPGRKRPGPVTIGWNEQLLSRRELIIQCGDLVLSDRKRLEMLQQTLLENVRETAKLRTNDAPQQFGVVLFAR